MKMRVRFLLVLAAVSTASGALAQTPTPFVAIRGLTVEGRDPPGYLRDALDDETAGVMHGFDVCYANRHAVRGDLAGELSLRLWVSAQQVIRVTPEGSTFADDDLVRCVKQRLLEFRLPPQAPRAGATVRFSVVFTPPASGNAILCNSSGCNAVPCGTTGGPCCPANACTDAALACIDSVCAVPPPPPPPPVMVTVTRARGGMTSAELEAAFPPTLFATCLAGIPSGRSQSSVTVTRAGEVRTSPLAGATLSRTARTCIRDAMAAVHLETRSRPTAARLTVAAIRR